MNLISEAVLTKYERILTNHAVYETGIGYRRTGRQSTTLLVVKGKPDNSARLEILRSLEKRPGIISAKFVSQRVAFLMVNYFHDVEQVQDIIYQINESGAAVRRIC